MDPFISIITVCYNSEKTIEDTLKSVLNQSYQNFEYIIVDGLSADHTIDIINKYKQNFGNKLKWISEKDHGLYDAMNKGIRMAKGEIIGMINSDDWYLPNTLQIIANNYEQKTDIYYGHLYYVKNINGIWYSEKGYSREAKYLVNRNVVQHPTCFITKDYYNSHQYDSAVKIDADYKFFLEAYMIYHANFKLINEFLAIMRYGGVSSSPNFSSDFDCFKFRKKILKPIYKNYLNLLKRLIITARMKIAHGIYLKFVKGKKYEVKTLLKTGWRIIDLSALLFREME